MEIGSTIKKLRRERDITQEQLAEYLGISSRAVSQWECGRTAPDISQVPALAHLFEVSADVLFGIDMSRKEKQIQDLIEQAKAYWEQGYHAKGEEILRKGLQEYPNSYPMMLDLMSCIWRIRDEPQNEGKRKSMTKEVIELGEKILDGCTDTEIRNGAVQLLCYTYPETGDTGRAVSLAEKMPDRYLIKERLLSSIYTKTKRFVAIRDILFDMICDLFSTMLFNNGPLDDKSRPYTDEELILLYKKYFAMMELVFEDGNYGFCRQELGWANIEMAMVFMRLNDYESAIECLRTAANHSIQWDTEYDPEDEYTCILFRGKKFGGVLHNITENDSLHQLQQMKDPVFDPIRLTDAFLEIEDSLKKYASRHEVRTTQEQ